MPNSETGTGRAGTLFAACLPLSLFLWDIGTDAQELPNSETEKEEEKQRGDGKRFVTN